MPTTKTPPTLADLEGRVLAGDASVTAADLAAARDAEALAVLREEAERQAEQRQAAQSRADELEQLRREALALDDGRDDLLGLCRAAAAALDAVVAAAKARELTVAGLVARARSAGAPDMGPGHELPEGARVGWYARSGLPGVHDFRVDDVEISAPAANELVHRLYADAVRRHSLRPSRHSVNTAPTIEEQVAAMLREVHPPERVVVRAVRRWGPNQPGTLVGTDPVSADWAVARGYAEWTADS